MTIKALLRHMFRLGAGACLVSALHAAPALTVKGGGQLIVNSTLTVNSADILVETGATMRVETGSVTNADILEIQTLGRLEGCGTINAAINNNGLILADCGTSPGLTLTGSVTNSGEVVLFNNTRLTATSSPFVNTGVLDLRNGDQTLPTNLSGNGAILTNPDSIWAYVSQIIIGDPDITVEVMSSAAYNYQLQYTLNFTTWTPVPGVQSGGGTITFTHSGGADLNNRVFYRVVETIP